MDHAALVGVREGLRNLAGPFANLRLLGPAARFLLQVVAQALRLAAFARDVIHGQVIDAVGLAHGVDHHDSGMSELGHHAGFVVEARDEAVVGGQFPGQDLQGVLLPQVDVLGQVDFAHPTCADGIGDSELPKLFAHKTRHGENHSRRFPFRES